MSFLAEDKKTVAKMVLLRHFKEECVTGKQVLELLYGDPEDPEDPYNEYIVKFRYFEKCKSSILQRFNVLWFIPLYILSIPLQYLIRGRFTIDNDSTFGKLIIRLVGENI